MKSSKLIALLTIPVFLITSCGISKISPEIKEGEFERRTIEKRAEERHIVILPLSSTRVKVIERQQIFEDESEYRQKIVHERYASYWVGPVGYFVFAIATIASYGIYLLVLPFHLHSRAGKCTQDGTVGDFFRFGTCVLSEKGEAKIDGSLVVKRHTQFIGIEDTPVANGIVVVVIGEFRQEVPLNSAGVAEVSLSAFPHLATHKEQINVQFIYDNTKIETTVSAMEIINAFGT